MRSNYSMATGEAAAAFRPATAHRDFQTERAGRLLHTTKRAVPRRASGPTIAARPPGHPQVGMVEYPQFIAVKQLAARLRLSPC